MPAALNPKPCARWEVDKYLAATGYLPPTVRPFFVALPKVRGAALAGGPPRRGPPQGDLRPPGPLPSINIQSSGHHSSIHQHIFLIIRLSPEFLPVSGP